MVVLRASIMESTLDLSHLKPNNTLYSNDLSHLKPNNTSYSNDLSHLKPNNALYSNDFRFSATSSTV